MVVYLTKDWSKYRHFNADGWKTVYTVIFNTACTEVLFSADAIIRIYNIESGEEVAALEGHAKQVRCLCISRDDKLAFSGGHDRCIQIWDLQTRKSIGKLVGHENFVLTIALTPDESIIASSGSDSTVRIWDVRDQRMMAIMRGH